MANGDPCKLQVSVTGKFEKENIMFYSHMKWSSRTVEPERIFKLNERFKLNTCILAERIAPLALLHLNGRRRQLAPRWRLMTFLQRCCTRDTDPVINTSWGHERRIPGGRATYLLTPWCRVLLEKLTGLQLVKKFPAFHRTRRFIAALTSVRHLSLSWARPI